MSLPLDHRLTLAARPAQLTSSLTSSLHFPPSGPVRREDLSRRTRRRQDGTAAPWLLSFLCFLFCFFGLACFALSCKILIESVSRSPKICDKRAAYLSWRASCSRSKRHRHNLPRRKTKERKQVCFLEASSMYGQSAIHKRSGPSVGTSPLRLSFSTSTCLSAS